ncbi:hypothetical protein [Spirillospora sp. NPDC029432]|uniref:hypothetical protein n=1 Tax=Spirillospora sp. NPDC029432 TaxID=3154599 RepID=UPI003456BF81
MSGRWRRIAPWALMVPLTAALAAAWWAGLLDVLDKTAGPVAVLLQLAIFLSGWAVAGRPGTEGGAGGDGLDDGAAKLADAVEAFWADELAKRGLVREHDLLPVDLLPLDPTGRPGGPHAPVTLDSVRSAVDAYSAVGSRCWVILGGPGSGKTLLAALITVGLVRQWKRRAREEDGVPRAPVPVYVSLAGWEPSERSTLVDWIVARLEEGHAYLTGARALLEAGRVRPVLDGLDEIGVPRDRPGSEDETRRLRSEALAQIADWTARWDREDPERPGVVLTGLTGAYRSAVSRTRTGRQRAAIPGARVDEVRPLGLDRLREHAARMVSPTQRDRWASVLRHLEQPVPAAGVLANPLMATLAFEVYDDDRRDPHDLLAYADTASLERHLLSSLVDHAYPEDEGAAGDGGDARPRDWLAHLARRVRDEDRNDIRWWELTGRWERILAALVTVLCVGPAAGLGFGLLFFEWLHVYRWADPVWGAAAGGLLGAGWGLGLGAAAARGQPPPSQLRFRGARRRLPQMFRAGALTAIFGGAAGWAFTRDWAGLAAGVAFVLPIALVYSAASPDATVRVADPQRLLRTDRTVAAVFGAAYGAPITLLTAFTVDPLIGVVLGLFCAAAGAFTYGAPWVAAMPSGQAGAVAIVRLWLARVVSRGRLPRDVLGALDDAYRRNVLRRVGPVYEFRHAWLRDVLAGPLPAGDGDRRADPDPDPDPVGGAV